jgi:hypothetical protein
LTTAEDKTRLYELVLDNGCPVSPYVWRIRYALAHKGLSCETVPLGFTEISRAFSDRFKTVPERRSLCFVEYLTGHSSVT